MIHPAKEDHPNAAPHVHAALTIMGLQKEWQRSANGDFSPLALLLANTH